MLIYGAHLIKNGGGPLVNWLVENGFVTHVATQGAGIIHDWEFAFAGVSSESVAENAPAGRFGSWEETGRWLNLAVVAGAADGLGVGEAVGRFIAEEGLTLPMPEMLAEQIAGEPDGRLTPARADLLRLMTVFDIPAGPIRVPHPFANVSVPAACYRARVPMTVHPGIGYDIYVNHPMFCGAAWGRGADTDVRTFAGTIQHLSGGVVLSVGSAIMAPQVFEKAISAVNNLRGDAGRIRDHLVAIVDLQDGGGWDWSAGEPPEDHPAYYLRFCKSFYRVADEVSYLCGDNVTVLSNLIARLRD